MELNYEDVALMDLEEVADELLRMAAYRLMLYFNMETYIDSEDKTAELVESAIKIYRTINGIDTWS